MTHISKLSLIAFFLVLSSYVQSQVAVTPGIVRIDATYNHISINFSITGDADNDSELNIRYRLSGTTPYEQGAMTMRAYPGLVIDGNTTSKNFHAGSILFLAPGITYDIECELLDPDGGSLTTMHTVSTKDIPVVPSSANVKYVSPGNGGGIGTQASPYLGLQSAADNAQPGDHFIVATGTYDAFTILISGNLSDPISFISEVQHGAVIDGDGTDRGVVTLGEFSSILSHIIINGFVIEDGKWGIDAQNTQHVTIRNNVIQEVEYGYLNRRANGNESDQYITNNLILGTTIWPGSGIPGERGIDLRGNNNVVSYNTIRDFGDGISTDGPPYETSYSLDIHNNDIQNIVDDLIEVDGMISNSRVYENRCYNGRAGVSLAPIFGGPAYVFRNIFYNLENSAFKMNRGPSGMVVVHNTAVAEGNAMSSPNGWQNTFYRNNVILSARYCFEFFGLVSGSDDNWDYGAYYSSRAGGSGTEWFKWDNLRYADVPVLNNSGIIESNAIAVTPSDFDDMALPTAYTIEYDPMENDFRPILNSAGLDNGDNISLINEPYLTDGLPDMGALEFGQAVPRYGHLFDISTDAHIVMSDDCIEIFPNPFTDRVVLDGDISDFTIEVLDSSGQMVADFSGSSVPFEIVLSSLGSGLYFVNVISNLHNQLSVHKIIKEQ